MRQLSENQILSMMKYWKLEDRRAGWQEVSTYSPQLNAYWTQLNSIISEDGLRNIEDPEGIRVEWKQLIISRRSVQMQRSRHADIGAGYVFYALILMVIRNDQKYQ